MLSNTHSRSSSAMAAPGDDPQGGSSGVAFDTPAEKLGKMHLFPTAPRSAAHRQRTQQFASEGGDA